MLCLVEVADATQDWLVKHGMLMIRVRIVGDRWKAWNRTGQTNTELTERGTSPKGK